jgi:hypothetical protein
MKRVALLALAAMAIAALTVTQLSLAKDATAKAAKSKTSASQYLVIAPHTPEQCAKALDDASAAGSLSKWNFGCMDGDHTGYLMVTATSTEQALANVPADERSGARAVKLHHFTAAELKDIHAHMAEASK